MARWCICVRDDCAQLHGHALSGEVMIWVESGDVLMIAAFLSVMSFATKRVLAFHRPRREEPKPLLPSAKDT